ncbi:MAG: UDP-glucose 6-dehydrogenase [Alphaproteobacteria bacterium RIFCSPLOWO2_01_FULL_40_26]|nr:MAG: UDP-glucose 6-dehydrogenase [Alphaproteobacteria bacterium RIFCSPHIGHO2_02_FULL_40_34]OFW85898.1 MAG: UDP-glucose 6-dehydrogenase [Alphaproteobacteria bacterium RIFCSPHIGHO2_01_FULL_40_8]OFW95047.1 MAG: UDP-glucose 6-dehydrogenase [Alphaproteobacteria bacterium RIFCSPLOWO2_01_FULL_40_26]OFX09862.1 MAG: UDP-glucose 6-dehydrogenase [Alphaproteobacteria bacterium RIFCSPLOWO2_02_FULL_40_19]OFX11360.1 MAG: UDP-glucose 6-dehydrogenase [Alphaproteobacteria bacterium RIFCSPLOWO2_12_FULL_40_11]
MKITVIGSGYVGLVSGICFAKLGHEVVCVDKDETKISKLKSGVIPIFEPGLKELLHEVVAAKKISFTTNLREALNGSKPVFIAVGTPQDEDGSADLSYVLSAAKEIAQLSNSYKLIITKSTVPAKTGAKIKKLVLETNPSLDFAVASNPEFLREGCAINDFMNPDRIVIGVADEKSQKILAEIYQKFSPQKLVFTDIITAELIKYASNSFLATKISFINEIADLCEIVGGDIKQLAHAIGLDSRIGEKFLNPGPGFGGSCFPKDIMAIVNVAQENKVDLSLINSVIASNKNRKMKMLAKISAILDGKITGKKIALLGLAFKANTDDIRYSPAISIAKELLKEGAKISAHDFEAIENSKHELTNFSEIEFFDDVYEAMKDADLIVIATEWPQYRKLDFTKISTRKIVDLRNLFDAKKMHETGFEYFYIGGKS